MCAHLLLTVHADVYTLTIDCMPAAVCTLTIDCLHADVCTLTTDCVQADVCTLTIDCMHEAVCTLTVFLSEALPMRICMPVAHTCSKEGEGLCALQSGLNVQCASVTVWDTCSGSFGNGGSLCSCGSHSGERVSLFPGNFQEVVWSLETDR